MLNYGVTMMPKHGKLHFTVDLFNIVEVFKLS